VRSKENQQKRNKVSHRRPFLVDDAKHTNAVKKITLDHLPPNKEDGLEINAYKT